MSGLVWEPFGTAKVVVGDTYLCEVASRREPFRYETGRFFVNSEGRVFGIIGGRFHFDCEVTRISNIQHLIPEVDDEQG